MMIVPWNLLTLRCHLIFIPPAPSPILSAPLDSRARVKRNEIITGQEEEITESTHCIFAINNSTMLKQTSYCTSHPSETLSTT